MTRWWVTAAVVLLAAGGGYGAGWYTAHRQATIQLQAMGRQLELVRRSHNLERTYRTIDRHHPDPGDIARRVLHKARAIRERAEGVRTTTNDGG